MNRKSLGLLIAVIFVVPSFLKAESWQMLGPQPMGMGGSFVGVARGNLAQYWNPAGLGQENNVSGLQIPVGARAEFTGGILKDAHNLSNIASKYSAIQDAQKSGSAMDSQKIGAFFQGVSALDSLNKTGKGVLIDISGGVNLKIGRYALSVINYTSVGAKPFVDTVNIGLGVSAAAGMTGVQFDSAGTGGTLCAGSNCYGAPANAARQSAADAIETALGASGFTSLNSILNGELVANGITDADKLGNALVNISVSSGSLTDEQITAAAQMIAENAAVAVPILNAAASGNPYTNNLSNLTLRGGSFTEVSLGTARQLIVPGLLLGVNLKLIQGRIGYYKFEALKKEAEAGDFFSDFDKYAKQTVRPGVDIGVLYDMNKTLPFLPFRPRAGIVARNINRPKFDQPDKAKENGESAKYPLDTQARMGLAFNPFNFWTLATDIDLTENKTPVSTFKSRMFGAGTEINIFNRRWLNIPLRFGLNKNIAESGSKISYAGGFGLNFLHVIVDVGGSISTESEKFKDENGKEQTAPANASAAAQLAILF